MKALVTGASGFAGRHLVRHLLEAGDDVTGVSTGPAPAGPALSGPASSGPASSGTAPPGARAAADHHVVDVRDASAVWEVVERCRPDVIYHLAGVSFVPDAESRFENALAVNVGGTHAVFKAVAKLSAPVTVVLVSTGEVYGRVPPSDVPVTEDRPADPASAYALTKAMAELVPRRYAGVRGLRAVVVRPFNHVGPGQDERFVAPAFATQLAEIAAGRAEPVVRVGNLGALRDFSDVRDVVRGYRLAAIRGRSSVYNLGRGEPVPVAEILETLIRCAGLDVRVEADPARYREAEVPVLYPSVTRAAEELGWSAGVSLEQSLAGVYEDAVARTRGAGE